MAADNTLNLSLVFDRDDKFRQSTKTPRNIISSYTPRDKNRHKLDQPIVFPLQSRNLTPHNMKNNEILKPTLFRQESPTSIASGDKNFVQENLNIKRTSSPYLLDSGTSKARSVSPSRQKRRPSSADPRFRKIKSSPKKSLITQSEQNVTVEKGTELKKNISIEQSFEEPANFIITPESKKSRQQQFNEHSFESQTQETQTNELFRKPSDDKSIQTDTQTIIEPTTTKSSSCSITCKLKDEPSHHSLLKTTDDIPIKSYLHSHRSLESLYPFKNRKISDLNTTRRDMNYLTRSNTLQNNQTRRPEIKQLTHNHSSMKKIPSKKVCQKDEEDPFYETLIKNLRNISIIFLIMVLSILTLVFYSFVIQPIIIEIFKKIIYYFSTTDDDTQIKSFSLNTVFKSTWDSFIDILTKPVSIELNTIIVVSEAKYTFINELLST